MLVCCESFKLLKYTNIWTLKQENCSLLTFHILEMWEEPIAAACTRPLRLDYLWLCLSKGFFSLSHQLFEGLKAYNGEDKRLRLFRPMLNMKRMSKSAKRVCLPVRQTCGRRRILKKKMAAVLIALSFVPEAFDESELVECIRRLVEIDQDWAFLSESSSHLYIRPTFISTEVEMAPYCFWTCSFYFSRFSVVLPP